MDLSANFSLDELTISQTATRRGIDNEPDAPTIDNLQDLVTHVLQPIRDHFGKPVIITSGYRSPTLNAAIGGSTTSDHCRGAAADFTVKGVPNLEVMAFIMENLHYKQLIDEFGAWIHVSYLDGANRNQDLTARKVKGRTVYSVGIVT